MTMEQLYSSLSACERISEMSWHFMTELVSVKWSVLSCYSVAVMQATDRSVDSALCTVDMMTDVEQAFLHY